MEGPSHLPEGSRVRDAPTFARASWHLQPVVRLRLSRRHALRPPRLTRTVSAQWRWATEEFSFLLDAIAPKSPMRMPEICGIQAVRRVPSVSVLTNSDESYYDP
jgi:hypothetical protein